MVLNRGCPVSPQWTQKFNDFVLFHMNERQRDRDQHLEHINSCISLPQLFFICGRLSLNNINLIFSAPKAGVHEERNNSRNFLPEKNLNLNWIFSWEQYNERQGTQHESLHMMFMLVCSYCIHCVNSSPFFNLLPQRAQSKARINMKKREKFQFLNIIMIYYVEKSVVLWRFIRNGFWVNVRGNLFRESSTLQMKILYALAGVLVMIEENVCAVCSVRRSVW